MRLRAGNSVAIGSINMHDSVSRAPAAATSAAEIGMFGRIDFRQASRQHRERARPFACKAPRWAQPSMPRPGR